MKKIRSKIILILSMFLSASILPGQTIADDSAILQNNQIIADVHARGGLIFASPPYWGEDNTRESLDKLVEYISGSISQEIVLVILKDYEMLKARTIKGEIDIGFYGPTIYIETKKIYPQLKYIATVILKSTEKAYYYSYLISKKGSGLVNIESLKGKSFAFGSRESTSGYMYPRAWMEENNLDPHKFFGRVEFLNSHNDVIHAIATGEIDAGTVSPTPVIKAENDNGILFTRIRKFGPIPNSLIAVNPGLSDATIENFTNALTELPSVITNVKEFNYSGFTILSDAAYDRMRNVIQITKECEIED